MLLCPQYLLDEPHTALSRAFSKVVALLQLGLSTTDPVVHLPTLQTHLVSLLGGSGNGVGAAMPAPLVKVLIPLLPRLPSIIDTASALAGLLARTDAFAHLPTPPTACALLMLALEAELSSSLPNAGAFAAALGARLAASDRTVMQRYKEIYDLVEEWIREVPWLDAHERKPGKGSKGRSKVAKRVVVARGLKDVMRFQEEIWRKRIEHDGRPLVQLDVDDSEKGKASSGDEWRDSSEVGSSSGSKSSRSTSVLGEDHAPPRKKARTRHAKTIVDASHFLLDPLSVAGRSSSSSSLGSASSMGSPDLLAHLLTAEASSLPHAFAHVPSRLQLLASARGGTEEHHIADAELFAEDELEGLMRSPEEVEAVRIAMGWDIDDENADADGGARNDDGNAPAKALEGKGKKRKRKLPGGGDGLNAASGSGAKPRGSKKIDMEALARLLDPDGELDLAMEDTVDTPADDRCEAVGQGEHNDEEDDEDWEEAGEESAGSRHEGANPAYGAGAEEIVEEWRPLSPGGGGGLSEDWFEF